MSIDLPGFADPVTDAQSCFRGVLEAMSRPGDIRHAGRGLTPPPPLDPATAAVLLTLADSDTPVWLAPDFAAVEDWIAFHCGARRVADIADASFVVSSEIPDLTTLNTGTDDGPEESATLILQVPALSDKAVWRLAGPGLRVPAGFEAGGLPADFATRWTANHALFPRGVDMILCAGTTLAALPRSVRIEKG